MTAKEAYENLINSFINEENVNTFEGRLKVFADQICRDFNGFMIDKCSEEPSRIPLIDDVLDEFLNKLYTT